MQKKGFIDADWAISLGIFLLYLAWFFVFINPIIGPRSDETSLLRVVNDGVKEDLYWHVVKIPIFIDSEITQSKFPIVINYPYNFSNPHFSLTDEIPFEVENQKMVLLPTLLHGTNTIYILNSSDTYENTVTFADIFAQENLATTRNNTFRVSFQESLPKSIYYVNQYYANEINITLAGAHIPVDNSTYVSSNLFARFRQTNDYFISDSYLFALNRHVKILFDSQTNDNDVKLTAQINLPRRFNSYFINNIYAGNLANNYSRCHEFDWNYIDFYDSDGGISFVLNKTSSINFCYDNQSIDLTVEFPINTAFLDVIVHPGDYRQTANLSKGMNIRHGIREKTFGISLDKFQSFNGSNYEQIKSNWTLTSSRDFNLYLKNTSETIVTYQHNIVPEKDDVYVDEIYCLILDKFANSQKCTLMIQTW